MTTPSLPITGVILAGGEGRRMGGQDKGWVEYLGTPLIQHVSQRLLPQVSELLINANRNRSDYQSLGYPVTADLESGFQGPLMGILTGLKAARQPWVLFTPCDGPFLPEDLAERLYQAALNSQQPIAVASDGERLQPVVVLIKRDCLTQLEAAMQDGERKPDRWYAKVGMTSVVFAAASLRNFNRPEEVI
jgi:molybdopterin-guanine dinucleotide biosynthesis protein A